MKAFSRTHKKCKHVKKTINQYFLGVFGNVLHRVFLVLVLSWDWERPRNIKQHPTFKKERDGNDCLILLVYVVLQSHQGHNTQFSGNRLDLQLVRLGQIWSPICVSLCWKLFWALSERSSTWMDISFRFQSLVVLWCSQMKCWSLRARACLLIQFRGTCLLPLCNVVWWCNVLLNTFQLSAALFCHWLWF